MEWERILLYVLVVIGVMAVVSWGMHLLIGRKK